MGVRGNDRQIDNIEFNVSDISRSKDFYGSAFGWTFVDYGPSYTEFSDVGSPEDSQLESPFGPVALW